MSTILLTGVTGNIGSEVARLFLKDGLSFRAIARDPGRAAQLFDQSTPGSMELVQGDYSDLASLTAAMEGMETLFLVSSDPSLEFNVVKAAKTSQVKRIVKSSAIGFKMEPPAGHRAVETFLMESGIAYTIVRPTAFMQTLAGYLPQLVDEQGNFFLPAGNGRTAWIDTRDIAAVVAHLLRSAEEQAGKIYRLTGPEALSMEEVAAVVSEVAQSPFRYHSTSADQARHLLQKKGMGQLADFLVAHYKAVAEGGFEDVSHSVLKITGAEPGSFKSFASDNRGIWKSAVKA